MKIFASSLLLLMVMIGCKPKVYTDQNGRRYILQDSCLYGHSYTYTSYIMAGKVMVPMTNTRWKCDSSQTLIVYIK